MNFHKDIWGVFWIIPVCLCMNLGLMVPGSLSPCEAMPLKTAGFDNSDKSLPPLPTSTKENRASSSSSWWQRGTYPSAGWLTLALSERKQKSAASASERKQKSAASASLASLQMMPTWGWLQTQPPPGRRPSDAIDPSLPPPLSTVAVPPVEWPLVLLQGFSGMVVAGVSSFLLQTLVDLLVIGPLITVEDLEKSGVISTIVVLAVVPWMVAGTVYGVGQLSNNYRGSFWWALIGAYAGEGLAFGVGLLLNAVDTSDKKNISRLIRFLLDGLFIGFGSVLFYTLFRSSTGSFLRIGSLMQWNGQAWTWGVPLPRVSQTEQQETLVSFPLLSGQF